MKQQEKDSREKLESLIRKGVEFFGMPDQELVNNTTNMFLKAFDDYDESLKEENDNLDKVVKKLRAEVYELKKEKQSLQQQVEEISKEWEQLEPKIIRLITAQGLMKSPILGGMREAIKLIKKDEEV